MLSVSDKPIPAFEPLKVDVQLAARGRQQFAALGAQTVMMISESRRNLDPHFPCSIPAKAA